MIFVWEKKFEIVAYNDLLVKIEIQKRDVASLYGIRELRSAN